MAPPGRRTRQWVRGHDCELAAVYQDCAVSFNRGYFGRYSGPKLCGSNCATVWLSGAPSTPCEMTTTS